METQKQYLDLTDATFEENVLKASLPVLVDFTAQWCGPCKMIAPVIEQLATEYQGKATVSKIDVDENPQSTVKYGVKSLPTLLIFKDGTVVDKIIGAVPKKAIADKLAQYV